MSEIEPVKTSNDLVKLVNVSSEGETIDKEGKKVQNKQTDVNFTYDGNSFVVKTHLRIKRFLAEHALRKGFSFAQGRNLLKIVELPVNERSAELYPETNEAMKNDVEKLKKEIAEKDKVIETLETEISKLEKKLKK